MYENGNDYIGMHSDKTKTWKKGSNFQVIKWGCPRIFQMTVKDNPDVEQVHTGINIVAGVGRVKGDSGWKENLSRIAEAHPRSALADRHGNKSIKDIKTKQHQ